MPSAKTGISGTVLHSLWRLTYSKMGVDARIPRSSREVLVLSIRDVLVRCRIPVLLCQSKVNYVHLVCSSPQPHQEVIWLDVTMEEALRVNILNPIDLQSMWKPKRQSRQESVLPDSKWCKPQTRCPFKLLTGWHPQEDTSNAAIHG
jgi:hypothetical protein